MKPLVGVWTDSSLFGADGEKVELETDVVPKELRHKLHSQSGCFVAMLDEDQVMSGQETIDFSVCDWRTHASRRVLHSTFAAEATTALEAVGSAVFLRTYFVEIMLGDRHGLDVTEYGEHHVKTMVFTDCKSVYDNICKECSIPVDRLVAISIASLRGVASARPQRDEEKTCMKWVPTRWQLADALTKPGLESVLATRLASANSSSRSLGCCVEKEKG